MHCIITSHIIASPASPAMINNLKLYLDCVVPNVTCWVGGTESRGAMCVVDANWLILAFIHPVIHPFIFCTCLFVFARIAVFTVYTAAM